MDGGEVHTARARDHVRERRGAHGGGAAVPHPLHQARRRRHCQTLQGHLPVSGRGET